MTYRESLIQLENLHLKNIDSLKEYLKPDAGGPMWMASVVNSYKVTFFVGSYELVLWADLIPSKLKAVYTTTFLKSAKGEGMPKPEHIFELDVEINGSTTYFLKDSKNGLRTKINLNGSDIWVIKDFGKEYIEAILYYFEQREEAESRIG